MLRIIKKTPDSFKFKKLFNEWVKHHKESDYATVGIVEDLAQAIYELKKEVEELKKDREK
jgi:hypothetical protein